MKSAGKFRRYVHEASLHQLACHAKISPPPMYVVGIFWSGGGGGGPLNFSLNLVQIYLAILLLASLPATAVVIVIQ